MENRYLPADDSRFRKIGMQYVTDIAQYFAYLPCEDIVAIAIYAHRDPFKGYPDTINASARERSCIRFEHSAFNSAGF